MVCFHLEAVLAADLSLFRTGCAECKDKKKTVEFIMNHLFSHKAAMWIFSPKKKVAKAVVKLSRKFRLKAILHYTFCCVHPEEEGTKKLRLSIILLCLEAHSRTVE